jgi:hypothetical protein
MLAVQRGLPSSRSQTAYWLHFSGGRGLFSNEDEQRLDASQVDCIIESLSAALRFEPECLLVLSREGWSLVRNEMFRNAGWQDDVLGAPATRISYCVIAGKHRKTEIVGIARQLLSSHRICTNQEVFEAVARLRQKVDPV